MVRCWPSLLHLPGADLDPKLGEKCLEVVAALELKVSEAELDLGGLIPQSLAGRGDERSKCSGDDDGVAAEAGDDIA